MKRLLLLATILCPVALVSAQQRDAGATSTTTTDSAAPQRSSSPKNENPAASSGAAAGHTGQSATGTMNPAPVTASTPGTESAPATGGTTGNPNSAPARDGDPASDRQSEKMQTDREAKRDGAARPDAGNRAPTAATDRSLMRARDVVEARLYDPAGNEIGTVENVLLDENSGRIDFAVVDVGGWLGGDGAGNVLVPWKELSPRPAAMPDPGSSGGAPQPAMAAAGQTAAERTGDAGATTTREMGFTLAATRERMQGAPRLENWDRENKEPLQAAVKFWGANDEATQAKLVEATAVRDAKLMDASGKEIGDIEALLVDPRQGRATFAVISVTEAPNRGQNLTAVPFEQVRQSPSEDPGYVLNVPSDKLRTARYFGTDSWPDLRDAAWTEQARSHFGSSM